MKLYRGTPEPESQPRKREHPCVFFSPDWDYAATYAAGEVTGWNRGMTGWVQLYDVGPQNLLDYQDDRAWELSTEWTGDDEVSMDLFRFPDFEWIGFLEEHGYTGTTNGEDICIFDFEKAKLLKWWKVENVGEDGYRIWEQLDA